MEGTYRIGRSLAEWVDIYRSRKNGDPGQEFTFELMYVGSGDSDVVEYHRINTGGTLVEPIENQDGAWRIASVFERNFDSETQPLERVYWKSRRREEKF